MNTLKIPQATSKGYIECGERGAFDMQYASSTKRRGRVQGNLGDISPSLTVSGITEIALIDKITQMENIKERPEGKGWIYDKENGLWFRIRKLTPRECFRLMDVKENDIDKILATFINNKGNEEQFISNSQLYKCAGNSIVVNPMYLCFKNLFRPEGIPEGEQLTLF